MKARCLVGLNVGVFVIIPVEQLFDSSLFLVGLVLHLKSRIEIDINDFY